MEDYVLPKLLSSRWSSIKRLPHTCTHTRTQANGAHALSFILFKCWGQGFTAGQTTLTVVIQLTHSLLNNVSSIYSKVMMLLLSLAVHSLSIQSTQGNTRSTQRALLLNIPFMIITCIHVCWSSDILWIYSSVGGPALNDYMLCGTAWSLLAIYSNRDIFVWLKYWIIDKLVVSIITWFQAAPGNVQHTEYCVCQFSSTHKHTTKNTHP